MLTEPLAPERLAAINWTHRMVVNSRALTVDYLSRTADGRILFGGRGAPYHFGSSITPAYDRDEPTFARLRQSLVEWFPSLRGVRFTHAWGGCLGVPRDFMPIMRYDRASGIATARGYTGEGVAASNLSGRVLADLITGTDSPLAALPMTRHTGRNWEVEPFRFLATRLAERGAMKIDERGRADGRAANGTDDHRTAHLPLNVNADVSRDRRRRSGGVAHRHGDDAATRYAPGQRLGR